MSNKSWWPVWFPYPRAWLRALMLSAAMAMLGLIVDASQVWKVVLIWRDTPAFTLAISIAAVIALILPSIPVAYLHNFLLGNPPEKWPKSIPSPASLKEGLIAIAVNFFAGWMTLLVSLPLFLSCETSSCERSVVMSFYPPAWVVSSAFLYHWDYLIREKRQKK